MHYQTTSTDWNKRRKIQKECQKSKRQKKTCGTRYSHMVSHYSTDRASSCLSGRERTGSGVVKNEWPQISMFQPKLSLSELQEKAASGLTNRKKVSRKIAFSSRVIKQISSPSFKLTEQVRRTKRYSTES
jgi:hypothetical protein